jgi:hypothetical protein
METRSEVEADQGEWVVKDSRVSERSNWTIQEFLPLLVREVIDAAKEHEMTQIPPEYSAVIYSFSEPDSIAGHALVSALRESFEYIDFIFDDATLNGEVRCQPTNPDGEDRARAFAKGFVLGLRFQGKTCG